MRRSPPATREPEDRLPAQTGSSRIELQVEKHSGAGDQLDGTNADENTNNFATDDDYPEYGQWEHQYRGGDAERVLWCWLSINGFSEVYAIHKR
jgi:hypothetical protein